MKPHIRFFNEVTSTNTLLIEAAKEGAEIGTVFIADKQSQGRGRMNRSFFSPDGGIFLSILLPLKEIECITALAGAAVCSVILKYCKKECSIKWINDILIKDKKVCGILAQTAKGKNDELLVVLGIGINFSIKQTDFPEDIQDIACSIYDEKDSIPYSNREFALFVVQRIIKLVNSGNNSWLDFYRNHSAVIGKNVMVAPFGKERYSALVKSIDNNCHLHVINEDGEEKILSTGEISLRIKRN